MMEFINLVGQQQLTKNQKKSFLQILAPFAPHVTEELWEIIGEKFSIHKSGWPAVDEKMLEQDEVTIAIQVNGKVRDQLVIGIKAAEEAVIRQALASKKIAKYTEGKQPGKLSISPEKF